MLMPVVYVGLIDVAQSSSFLTTGYDSTTATPGPAVSGPLARCMAFGDFRRDGRMGPGAVLPRGVKLAVRQLEVTALAVVDKFEEAPARPSAQTGDVPGDSRERGMDDLAERRVVPGDDRHVPGDMETHFVGHPETGDREHVAFVDKRRWPLWADQQIGE